MITLGIETSCDETAAAIFDSEKGLISNELFSQVQFHKDFGGVVPEIASRFHLQKINLILEKALKSYKLEDIDNIAVTSKPGLPGSLLIGVSFAKAMAYVTQKRIIGINHLEAHAFSPLIENNIPFPMLCLTASGGHTDLFILNGLGDYEIIGQTLDDAAGEAFDKIAKLLNLPYPGGPIIEKLAQSVNYEDFFHYPRNISKSLHFSFSGLKTAVMYDLIKRNAYDMSTKTYLGNEELKAKVASSLLVCITDIFKQKLSLALKRYPCTKAITFAGGVACNKYIRGSLSKSFDVPFYIPSPQYCTDNAAMVAFVGNYKAQQGLFSNLELDILK